MHQALKTPEIFQLILFYIHDPKEPRSYHRDGPKLRPGKWWPEISTVNSLARTCQCFSKPSLDVLWYHQTTLRPLLKCLPDDLLRGRKSRFSVTQLSLTRELEQGDFTRVDIYARQIRILGHPELAHSASVADEEGVDAMIYAKIASRRSLWGLGPLLPNLIDLRIGLEKFCDLAWYPRLIIGPQLRSIDLVAFREEIETGVYDIHWGNILATLSPALPSLTSFTFSIPTATLHLLDGEIYTFGDREEEVQLEIIQKLSSPTILDIISVPLDAETIRHVANLQTIEVLAISIFTLEASDYGVQNLPELPNLIALRVEANDPDLCSTIIRQLGPKKLRSLYVTRLESFDDLWNIDQFITSLTTSRFMASIEDIEVITPIYEDKPYPNIPPITHSTILYLSHFKNLRSIRLYLNGEVHLSVGSLAAIAYTWPNLQVLDLRSRTRLGNSDLELRLNDLLVLSSQLHSLKEVRLRVDAQKKPMYAASDLPASGIAAAKLEILDVCTSPISNAFVEEVATLLGAAFPNLRKILYGWEWPERYGKGLLEVELSCSEQFSLESWRRVKEMLQLKY